MDRIKQYQKIIAQELNSWTKESSSDMPDIAYQFIENKKRTQFILLALGWHKNIYHHDLLMHIQIKNDQIWIQEDNTGVGISKILQEKGIPRSAIIHGFEEPILREQSKLARA